MNTHAWLERLVALDTTSRNSNLQLIEMAEAWFKQHGMVTRQTQDAKEKKANLFATLPARDGTTKGGIVLSGHTDVVPVDGQVWESDPFQLTRVQNKLVGRGTCDMKGFIAVALAMVPEFQKMALAQPIHFALSYDEEVGCRGAPLMIADMQKADIKPKFCIVGEPTEMQPVVAHKGIQVFRCRVHGRAAHSSLTAQGCNAIEYAAQLIVYLRQFAEQMRQEGPFDCLYDVPYTTLSTNMIRGGGALNIIPDHCEFFFEFRHLPEVKPRVLLEKITDYVREKIEPIMQREHANTKIEIDTIGVAPSFETGKEDALLKLMNSIQGESPLRKVAYATEAGLFQQADVPTIICGPGSIEQAHRPNEYVTVEQLEGCERMLRRVVQGV